MVKHVEKVLPSGYHPATRWLHAGLVLGVIFQLFCAALMTHPEHKDGEHAGSPLLQQEVVAVGVRHAPDDKDASGALFMTAHRNGGVLVAFIVLANLLWAVVARGRPRKRQIAVLFSARCWREAWIVAEQLVLNLMGRGSFPEPGNSLSLIVEMFGLLTMTAMAISGFIVWNVWEGPGSTVSEQAEAWMGMHAGIAVLLFIYLAGHIAMALLHMRAGDRVFARIVPVVSSRKIRVCK
ncbi:MAG: cytochrome b/b6 domain-containing protein [Mariprofundaceae bacterium]|nr:cytochrome b/b6 domain-containing protein [Mariprofundaceae bacterium]